MWNVTIDVVVNFLVVKSFVMMSKKTLEIDAGLFCSAPDTVQHCSSESNNDIILPVVLSLSH